MPYPEDPQQKLLKLLALKRHEVPPPGFFDRLPSRILVNLRAGARVEDVPWWTRAWQSLVEEPMVGVSYAALSAGAVLFGVSVLQTAVEVDSAPVTALQGLVPTSTFDPATGPAAIASTTSDLVVNPHAWAGSGTIYRVAEPSQVLWTQPSAFQPYNPGSSPGMTRSSNSGIVQVTYTVGYTPAR